MLRYRPGPKSKQVWNGKAVQEPTKAPVPVKKPETAKPAGKQ